MKKEDYIRTCFKCGVTGVTQPVYFNGVYYGQLRTAECLRMVCSTCGYEWPEPCWDKKKEGKQ